MLGLTISSNSECEGWKLSKSHLFLRWIWEDRETEKERQKGRKKERQRDRNRKERKKKKERKIKWGCSRAEVEMSTEGWMAENKERLLSVVLLIGKPPQAPQVERYHTDNCC